MIGHAVVWTALAALAGGTALPAWAVTLSYRPAPGGSMKYTLSVSSETRSVAPGNRLAVTKAKGRLNGVATMQPPDNPGEIAVVCRVTGGAMSRWAAGAVRRYAVPVAVQRVRMTTGGETLDWQTAQGPLTELEPPSRLMLEPADLCIFEGYGAFPDRDLQPGDTWAGHYDEKPSQPDEEPTRVAYRSKLLGLTQFRGRPCARIATDYHVVEDAPDQAQQDERSSLAVTLGGHVVWGFDVERGLILYYVETMTTSARFSLSQQGHTFAATVTSRTRFTGQMTEHNGVPLSKAVRAGVE